MALRQDREAGIRKFAELSEAIDRGIFAPIYVLSGEEPYYSDVILKKLDEKVLTPAQKDFNYSLLYASDTDAGQVVCLCRRYPVESDRQLVIIREAQLFSSLQPFENYIANPASDTVLVLAFTGKKLDKRTSFYKKLQDAAKKGLAQVMESEILEEWKVAAWITDYVKSQDYSIDSQAAQLLAQHAGTSLRKIVLELDKLFKGIDSKTITVKDVEINVGISRDFNAFELCKAIGEKNRLRCFTIADVFGNNPKKYPIQMTLGALFFYFNQMLRIEAAMTSYNKGFYEAAQGCGVFGPRQKEFETACRNYPLQKTMLAISLIKECDLNSKSAGAGLAGDGELLKELLAKVLL
ncbi:MAG: DNA polymerase III subunit delta [Candidatus Egerieousia sp.]